MLLRMVALQWAFPVTRSITQLRAEACMTYVKAYNLICQVETSTLLHAQALARPFLQQLTAIPSNEDERYCM